MIESLLQLLDWIYRRSCYFCHKPSNNGMMCKSCFESIDIFEPIPNRVVEGTVIYSASMYQDNLKKLIRALKYHNKKELAKPFSEIIYGLWKELNESKDEFEIVPVPLYRKRQKKRGYNHMELVAMEFSKLTGYKVNSRIVERVKDTKPQYKLSMFERRDNMRDAFKVNKDFYNGKRILIIDDICTTGTTLKELIRSFKKAGIDNLCAIVGACPNSLTVN